MYKKIAVFFLFVSLVVLAIGLYLVDTNKDKRPQDDLDNNSMLTDDLSSANYDDNIGAEADVDKNDEAKPARHKTRDKETLEKEINRQITIKATKIREEAQGRRYTDDELKFITNPRQNIIDNLAEAGELNSEEIDLLK